MISIGDAQALVRFDYEPAERETFDCPGSPANCSILEIEINGLWISPDYFSQRWLDSAEERLCEDVESAARDAKAEAQISAYEDRIAGVGK
jgi:hypothetical protein